MEIFFANARLAKACNQERDGDRRWGRPVAQHVRRRLNELAAADTLADMGHLPPARCHQLIGDHAGQFAVDAGPRFRVVFEPSHDPLPRRSDGGIDLVRVTAIVILAVEDYHD